MESHGPEAGAHLGGARADFVASLGRKIQDARTVLAAVEANPNNTAAREELRRKLHALGAGARLLRFDVMVETLGDADAIFERGAKSGSIQGTELAELTQMLDDLPALAWGESPSRDAALRARAEEEAAAATMTRTALIFGTDMLAEALTDEAYGGAPFDCERTCDVAAALGLARSLAPDLVLVDGDEAGALDLVEKLLDDPLTEPVPILVVGAFAVSEMASRFIAMGVTKTISKPVSPESLKQMAEDAATQREDHTARVSLGEPTMEQLGERLADEVRNALVSSVDHKGRACRVPLGEGTEVLGAIWGAIARVREVVTARTDGAVRFTSKGPEGAIAMAPWLHPEVARGDRSGRGRSAAADVKLAGRKVIVADDDPGVTWFIADLLKTAGCTVYEALDGTTALELAYEHSPDLVVSDILMPGLDGFALCRALKRDVALRDVPVVLLSWKEDLLQRVRELGASAAAYLRKESDSRAIVARVREVLRPRARVEARLKTAGEVRGRLDGLTVRALLELVCAIRPNSRVSVRDASFLYEIEIRGGSPRRATRTAGDGSFLRAEPVLAAILGVGAGRFIVADATGEVKDELIGDLAAQLRQPLAHARGAAFAVTGARIMSVERILLDDAVLEAYLRATPEPASEIIAQLVVGDSPRAILLSGAVDPGLLEDVLSDLAARGAISGVLGIGETDLLGPAINATLAVMRGEHRPPPSMPPSVKTKAARSNPPSVRAPSASVLSQRPSSSSIAAAVVSELSDSHLIEAAPSSPRPMIDPGELRARISSIPPADVEAMAAKPVTMPEPNDATDVDATAYGEKPEASIPITIETSKPELVALKEEASKTVRALRDKRGSDETASDSVPERTPLASVTAAAQKKPQRQAWQYATVLGAAVAVGWVALQMSGPAMQSDPEPPARPAHASPGIPDTSGVTFTDIATGTDVPPGQGVLEIIGAGDGEIRVDDVVRGHGAKVTMALVAGNHQVKLGPENDKKVRAIEVRAGRTTRFEVLQVP